MGKKHSMAAFFKGFVVGGTIGAVTALLTTPQSGEDNRSQIRDKSAELRAEAEATYGEMQKRAEKAIADLQRTADDFVAEGNQMVTTLRGKVANRAHDLAEEVEPEDEIVQEGTTA
jgi:gas vesicle protein